MWTSPTRAYLTSMAMRRPPCVAARTSAVVAHHPTRRPRWVAGRARRSRPRSPGERLVEYTAGEVSGAHLPRSVDRARGCRWLRPAARRHRKEDGMLSREDNELLCRVGRDTPMGALIREYWIPALVSTELPETDGPPVRVRLLGENLIAFRATSGRVGLIQNHCPHRGASLFFGRNEDEGIRCVYHGWKFDCEGACVDMPSEPEESNFKSKVRARAYPCFERNGIVWTYMGPRSTPPPLPDIEPNLL